MHTFPLVFIKTCAFDCRHASTITRASAHTHIHACKREHTHTHAQWHTILSHINRVRCAITHVDTHTQSTPPNIVNTSKLSLLLWCKPSFQGQGQLLVALTSLRYPLDWYTHILQTLPLSFIRKASPAREPSILQFICFARLVPFIYVCKHFSICVYTYIHLFIHVCAQAHTQSHPHPWWQTRTKQCFPLQCKPPSHGQGLLQVALSDITQGSFGQVHPHLEDIPAILYQKGIPCPSMVPCCPPSHCTWAVHLLC